MIVLLDKPPSTNSLFPDRKGGGRRKSQEYKSWRARQHNNLIAQRLKPLHGRVGIDILIDEASRVDLDNHLKAALDCLVHFGLIDGDGWNIVRHLGVDFGVIPDLHGVKMGARLVVSPHA